jgi:PHYB activation tagged suppressor 1
MEWLFWVLAALIACLGSFLLRIVEVIWWKPLQLKKYFDSQGIRGPPYKLLYGNGADVLGMITQAKSTPMPWSHDIVPRALPYYHHWTKTYGEDFVAWFGPKARLNVCHPDHIKEILSNKFGHYEKFSSHPLAMQLIGQGLVGLKGEKWVQHRRIINPAFHMDLLKGTVPTIVESTAKMLEEWSKLVLAGAEEFEMLKEFRNVTADLISRTAFGSSYAEGKHIFNLQGQQMALAAELMSTFYIPGFRFLPTRKNRQHWKLEKEIRRGMMQVIEARERTANIEKSGNYGTDLLGIMMSAKDKQVGGNLRDVRMTTEEIIDECKTFYVTGHQTTATLLTWTIILLAMHQDWQERGRKEVLEVCGKNVYPDGDSVNHLKIVGMILNEALRLYPPAVAALRQAEKPVKLGRFSLPAGTQLMIPILAMHHDPALWGNDANEFNPGRFSEGIAKATKHPLAFMPFGSGPRTCVGQNFALLEAKVVLAMFLQRFSFVTSPSYVHAPTVAFTLQPQHGAQVILRMN